MSNFDKHVLAFSPTHIRFGPIQWLQSIRKIINFWYTFGWKWWVISFRDYLGLSDSCSYDVIGRADRFGFQNFCSPAGKYNFSVLFCLLIYANLYKFWWYDILLKLWNILYAYILLYTVILLKHYFFERLLKYKLHRVTSKLYVNLTLLVTRCSLYFSKR